MPPDKNGTNLKDGSSRAALLFAENNLCLIKVSQDHKTGLDECFGNLWGLIAAFFLIPFSTFIQTLFFCYGCT